MAKIHPTAFVDPQAQVADSAEIGPLCCVGPHVKIGENCKLLAQCHIGGHTEVGEGNTFFPFSAIGMRAQDVHADPDMVSYVKIGNGNIFREGSTVHAGTEEGTCTVIGNNCMFMAEAHVAHNAVVGDNVIMVNCSLAAGHTRIGDNAVISGLVAVHQFCRVGRFAMLSGGSVFSKDIPPFMMAEGRNGGLKMVNVVGLKRAGFSDETIRALRNVFKIFVKSGLNQGNALATIKAEVPQLPEVVEFIEFCESSKRGVLCNREGHRE